MHRKQVSVFFFNFFLVFLSAGGFFSGGRRGRPANASQADVLSIFLNFCTSKRAVDLYFCTSNASNLIQAVKRAKSG